MDDVRSYLRPARPRGDSMQFSAVLLLPRRVAIAIRRAAAVALALQTQHRLVAQRRDREQLMRIRSGGRPAASANVPGLGIDSGALQHNRITSVLARICDGSVDV